MTATSQTITKAEKIQRNTCKNCESVFHTRHALAVHQRQQHRPDGKTRISDQQAALIRAINIYGPPSPHTTNQIAAELNVSHKYINAVIAGKCNRNPNAFPPGHPMLDELHSQYQPRPSHRTIKHRTYRISREKVAEHHQIQDLVCPYCHTKLDLHSSTKEHIVPISRDGTNALDNLQLTCKRCNAIKGNNTDQEFRLMLVFAKQYRHLAQGEVLRIAQAMGYNTNS